jgi:hypothetical protein
VITLRRFYEDAAPVHGMDPEAARMLGRVIFRGSDDAAARAAGGKDSSPIVTPYLAARFLIARFSGGQQKDAAFRVGGLWFTTRDGAESEMATILGSGPEYTLSEPKIPPLCSITGQMTFGDAVRAMVADANLGRQIDKIDIRHGFNDAVVTAKDGRSTRFVSCEALASVTQAEQAGSGQTFGRIPGTALEYTAHLLVSVG